MKINFVIFNVFTVLFCTVEGWRRMTIILTDSILSSAKISRFAYSTHCPSDACADKCPLCFLAHVLHRIVKVSRNRGIRPHHRIENNDRDTA